MSKFTVQHIGDEAIGYLVPFELPFKIERAYIICGVPNGVTRGRHAHRWQNQVFYCVKGLVTFECEDTKGNKWTGHISAGEAYDVPALVWHSMTYQEDAIVLAFGDGAYDETEYIRDLKEWQRLLGA